MSRDYERAGETSGSRSEPAEPQVSTKTDSLGRYQWLTNFHRDLMAGALMGGVVHTIVAPIERAKLLLQTQESNLAIVGSGRKRFKGMIDCIVRTVREEGILSLWRGNGSSVLRYYPSVALNFSLKVYEFIFFFLTFFLFVSFSRSLVWLWVNGRFSCNFNDDLIGQYGHFCYRFFLANVCQRFCFMDGYTSCILSDWWNAYVKYWVRLG